MLKVLEHILVTWPALEPEYRTYNDAIKDLQGESMVELQRLATDMPEHLLVSLLRGLSASPLLTRHLLASLRSNRRAC